MIIYFKNKHYSTVNLFQFIIIDLQTNMFRFLQDGATVAVLDLDDKQASTKLKEVENHLRDKAR